MSLLSSICLPVCTQGAQQHPGTGGVAACVAICCCLGCQPELWLPKFCIQSHWLTCVGVLHEGVLWLVDAILLCRLPPHKLSMHHQPAVYIFVHTCTAPAPGRLGPLLGMACTAHQGPGSSRLPAPAKVRLQQQPRIHVGGPNARRQAAHLPAERAGLELVQLDGLGGPVLEAGQLAGDKGS